jgi:hypothetical protein
MDKTKPEFPRPTVGDELILVTPGNRHREQRTENVRVRKMARFRITLEGPDGEDMPWHSSDFDIRTRAPWTDTPPSQRTSRSGEGVLHTAETWAWTQRESAASAYLSESGVHTFELRGTLSKAAQADQVGFANALRRFEGLDEI